MKSFMMCLRIENFVRDLLLCPYTQFSERCFFFFYAFTMKISRNIFPGHREDFFCLTNFSKNFCSVKKEAQVPKGFFRTSLFLRNKTLPSLIIIENADLRDATEWGALNRKSRLLWFARICNLLRSGMNCLFIEI